jgi:hypothetical protein
MKEDSNNTNFLAILIYEDGNGWRSEEPHVYSTKHPEIAYHMTLADGNEQRYGRRFLGLSHLEETTEEVPPITRSQKGKANDLVVGKEKLQAFADPRWRNVSCSETELREALREPPFLFEIDGLDRIPWHQYSHAYGIASEIPKDIRRLASSDAEVREQALWELFGSIYHQGTIYSATAAALPFLLRLALDERFPDRPKLCELLDAVAESAAVDPARLKETWAWRRKNFGEIYDKSTDELAAEEIANSAAVRQAFLDRVDAIQKLMADSNAEVSEYAASILEQIRAANAKQSKTKED